MLRIGVTGHTDLSPAAEIQVREGMRRLIQRLSAGRRGQLRGVSCLAPGADSIFAEIVLELGGVVEAVVPCRTYRGSLSPESLVRFDRLLRLSSTVDYMSDSRPDVGAYRSANAELLRRCSHLIAVWNRAQPVNPGGTGEVVSAAQDAGIPIDIIWPK